MPPPSPHPGEEPTILDPAAPAPGPEHSTSTPAALEPLVTPAFLRLCAFAFFTFIAAFQLFPTIPFHLLDLGATRTQAGLFLTAYTWASALSAPLTGALADRFGRRRMLLLAAAAFAVASLLYGVVRPLPLLMLVAVVHGFFWSGLLSASGALVADVIPASRRTEGLGYWSMAPTGAVAVAPAIGLAVYHLGWHVLMVELAVLALFLLVLATKLIPPGGGPHGHTTLREALSWRVTVCASTIFLIALGYGGITSYAALLATDRGVSPRSLFFTVFALSVIVTRLAVARIADRRGPQALLYPCLLLVPPALALLAVAGSRTTTVAAAALFGAGFGGAYPAFMTWVLGRTDPRHRAATFGSVLLALDTGIGTGSLLVGRIGDLAGLQTAFFAAAGVAALALPAYLLTRGLLPREPLPG